MPKLNTSVDDIQLVSNKVDNTIPLSTWTHNQYPSAKTMYDVFNRMYPIGSIMCMSENKNPGDSDALGIGTWTLVDKGLKYQWVALTEGSGWTGTNATVTSSAILVHGNNLSLRLFLKCTTATSDSALVLGTVDPTIVGLTGFPFTKTGLPFAIDGGEITGNIAFNNAGVVTLNDGWTVDGTHSINNNYYIPLYIDYALTSGAMIDEFCDRFYFKRTA